MWTIQLPVESEIVMKVIMLLEHRLLVFRKKGGKLKCEAYFILFFFPFFRDDESNICPKVVRGHEFGR